MKEFIYTQEKDFQMKSSNCRIKKFIQLLSKSLREFSDQAMPLQAILLQKKPLQNTSHWISRRTWWLSLKSNAISWFLMTLISKNWFLNLSPILHLTMHQKKSKRVTHSWIIIIITTIDIIVTITGTDECMKINFYRELIYVYIFIFL